MFILPWRRVSLPITSRVKLEDTNHFLSSATCFKLFPDLIWNPSQSKSRDLEASSRAGLATRAERPDENWRMREQPSLFCYIVMGWFRALDLMVEHSLWGSIIYDYACTSDPSGEN